VVKKGWLKSSLFFFAFSLYAKKMLSHDEMHMWNYGMQTGKDCQQQPNHWLQDKSRV
jgi:hypothetical protein